MLPTATLDEVSITHELSTRPSSVADVQALNAGLLKLARNLAASPHDVLQRSVEISLELCRAHTVGLSILEHEAGREVFRWRAMAGCLSSAVGSSMPRDNSPCGMVIDADTPLLFTYPELHFPFPGPVEPPIREVLLVPFHDQGIPVGTIWVVAHDEERKFDAQDVQILTELTGFMSSALGTLIALGYVQSKNAQIEYERSEGMDRQLDQAMEVHL